MDCGVRVSEVWSWMFNVLDVENPPLCLLIGGGAVYRQPAMPDIG